MTDDLKISKVDKSHWARTTKTIMLYLKLVMRMRVVSLAYVVRQNVKVVHTLPGMTKDDCQSSHC